MRCCDYMLTKSDVWVGGWKGKGVDRFEIKGQGRWVVVNNG